MENGQASTYLASTADSFASVLRGYRETVGLSQSRLAAASGFDHSYVSRLESGSRMPTRSAVVRLARAMSLGDVERDSLLVSAGFMPEQVGNLLSDEPIIGEVLSLLKDGSVPNDVREDLRNAVTMAVRQAQRATPSWGTSAGAQPIVAAD